MSICLCLENLNEIILQKAGEPKVLSVFHATLASFDVAPRAKMFENHTGKGFIYSFAAEI